MKMTSRLAVAAACALALSGGAAAAANAQQRISLPARDVPIDVTLAPVYRVGALDGEEWETFGNVTGVAFDASGNLYIMDTGNSRVVVVDARGRHVRSFGRKGGGPGEFMAPIGIAVDRDGNVVVYDAARGALQVLSTTGEYLRSVPLDGIVAGGRLAASRHAGVLLQTEQTQQTGTPGELSQGRPRQVSWFTFGEPAVRHLYSAPAQQRHQQEVGPGIIAFMPPALSARLHSAALPDGAIVATHTEEYRLTLVDRAGAQQRIIERPLAPRRVTEKDRRAYEAERASSQPILVTRNDAGGSTAPRHAQGPPAMPSATAFAERIQVVQGLAADPDGRIWISRGDRDGAALTDIVTSDGRYLGTARDLKLPTAFGPDGLTAYIERDDFDVQHIVVRRVRMPR